MADLLRRRLEALDATIAEHQEGMKAWGAGLPRLFLIESEYHLALRQAEAEWVRGLLKEFTDGTFPGLDGWRHFHETGEFPADLMPLIGPGTAQAGGPQAGGPQAAAREGDGAKQT